MTIYKEPTDYEKKKNAKQRIHLARNFEPQKITRGTMSFKKVTRLSDFENLQKD